MGDTLLSMKPRDFPGAQFLGQVEWIVAPYFLKVQMLYVYLVMRSSCRAYFVLPVASIARKMRVLP